MDIPLLEKYDRRVPRYTSYPTAPHFGAAVDGGTYWRWLAEIPETTPLSLYLHVPFCDTMCWFCGCHTKVVRRYDPVAAYLDLLLAEVDLVAGRLGPDRPVAHIHWGGGSPTILEAADIRRLGEGLRQRFAATPEAEFAVEIDPRGLTDAAIAALAAVGVNRASIGLQDINIEVQRAINRIQPVPVTRSAVDRLRAAGIGAINLDLMYGLPFQTTDHMLATVDAALELVPDRVSLFGYAHVPAMKRHQRLIPEASLPDGAARLAQAQAAAGRLTAAGYRPIGLDHFARPDDPLAVAAEAGLLRRNFQGYTVDRAPALIGLGPSAIGELPGGYVQNAVPMHAYREAIAGGRPATARGVAPGGEDRLRRAVIERIMCDLRVDLARVCNDFGADPALFRREMRALSEFAEDGVVEIAGDEIRVDPGARPLLRCVAAVFDTYLRPEEGRHARAV